MLSCSCCGETFKPTARPGGKPSKYCGKRCNSNAWARRASGWSAPTARVCAACKASFVPDAWHPNKIVCSRACSRRLDYQKRSQRYVDAAAAWKRANPEKVRAISRNNYRKNIEKKREQKKARNAGSLSLQQFHFMCWAWGYRCAGCGELFPPF